MKSKIKSGENGGRENFSQKVCKRFMPRAEVGGGVIKHRTKDTGVPPERSMLEHVPRDHRQILNLTSNYHRQQQQLFRSTARPP